MTDSVDVDTVRLRRAAGDTRRARGSLDDVMSTLSTALDAQGESPWGTDKIGSTFAEQYVPYRTNLETAGENMGTTLGSMADGQTTAAVEFDRMEAGNRDSFER